MLPTLNIVGAGRVGRTLAYLWHAHGQFSIQGVACRSPESAHEAVAFIGAGTAIDAQELPPADVWMLAVPDASIAAVAQSLATHAPPPTATGAAPVVFHCAGASGSELLQPLTDLGWRSASAHCILSFARADTAVAQFDGTVCALEGEASACALLQGAFEAIGGQCFALQRQDKLLYHAAAVFATNFLPVLQSVAEEAWAASGVPAALLPHLRQTLLANAVRNITTLGPAGALTGPAARGDTAHIARQSAVVHQWSEGAGRAYDALSSLALQLAQRRPPAQTTPEPGPPQEHP
ncbi:Rossmann-like and DUF2520 domain-containing protein [Curvibacter sp. APW13]|uniref:Rossmann-like and DUF2520 domain-containing protein n=1 Tax=Curvibacter sp. APW13 TaxID=3077236 RepID=UPI0028DF13C3|nr:Rossmann-like and DUF2520 domain-containing protein [Curvibacter sp. APW13]MDT8989995.1 Rossmann-like and DUF2520 domain-containing protein [Curvibacter sp. APW13]